MLRLLERRALCLHLSVAILVLQPYLTLQALKMAAGMALSNGLLLVTPMRQELVLARLSLGTDVYISRIHIHVL